MERFRVGTSPCVLRSEKTTAYHLRNSLCSLMILMLVYIKPRHMICNGDFSLLRVKSWDVTPWGLVDKPKQFGGTCCPPLFRIQHFFLSNPEDENAKFHQDVGTYVSDTTSHHIPWTHNLNTFYTENTDFTCIVLAFRGVQHDSSSWNGSIVKLSHARKLTFHEILFTKELRGMEA